MTDSPTTLETEDGCVVIVGALTAIDTEPAELADPPRVVTETWRFPARSTGVTKEIEVSLITVNEAASTPPIFTAVALLSAVPVIVMVAPPFVNPLPVLMLVIVGTS